MVAQGSGVTIQVNGKPLDVQSTPDTPLLYVLRNELGLHGPRFGCGLGQCGACTVHMGDQAVRSCRIPVGTVAGPITTLEGLSSGGQLHPMQQAFINEQAAQCGYCTNGMIMQSIVLVAQTPSPTEDQIRQGLANNLCRCGSHLAVIRAVQSVSA
ncbi:MAG: (2Fe-2S)-binding protein [Chloroflexi bacterium]|nr:(2Fe-2S)-binding protein [Chloroflexota bacterium]MBV9131315.1 (2Fe-2S)-binding protein [Chloroflexota bacterium]MBV9892727.1 (2Fe-2S)-binding protein [Chloroflexota bacterium]